ncbi:glycosyltransferase family 87 protein [Hyphococcus lacteus]|uniref:Glycosyltransferase family 87 protein n=1 Tax=Hyphococcus lacteus TaxID=3143536 RepID=A0ABV3Z4V7_9PROT
MTSVFAIFGMDRLRRDFALLTGGLLRRGMIISLITAVFFVVNIGTIAGIAATRDIAPVQDFFAFHAAAKVAAESGTVSVPGLYDAETFASLFREDRGMLWLYPPTMLLVLFPFGLVTYGAAKTVWVIASCVLLAIAAYRISNRNAYLTLAAMISPAAFTVLFTGQLSVFFACLALAGFLNAKARPILAGICFGLLTLKPQFGLLVPIFLLCTGSWRAMMSASVCAIVLAMMSVAAFGMVSWSAFFGSLTATHTDFIVSSGHAGRITLADTFRILGWMNVSTTLTTLFSVGIGGGLIVWAQRAGVSIRMLAALAMILTAVTAPYFWVYDWVFVAFAVLLFFAERQNLSLWTQALLVAVWFVPLSPYVGGSAILVPVIWLILFGATGAIACNLLRITGRPLSRQAI